MKEILTKNVLKYLSSLSLSDSTRIILTDLNKVIFDSKSELKEDISKELLRYLLTSNSHSKELSGKNIINILDNCSIDLKVYSQIILPIKHDKSMIKGCLIFINSNNSLDKGSIDFAITIRNNILLYSNITDKEKINSYEKGAILRDISSKSVLDIIDDSIYQIYGNNDYKNIEELIYYKVDALKNKLNNDEVNLLNNILNLLEEKKERYASYALTLGVLGSKNILNSIPFSLRSKGTHRYESLDFEAFSLYNIH